MNFTENQQNAIDVRDCSLIVSAGAGSGKTAVLTERILERICDENDDVLIDDFLIVTFTNAAAKELSDRIRKKLSERAEIYPENKKIVKNLALLPLAKIKTINAFCYEIVRENFQKLGLSANVRIADDAEISVIREKIMNEVVDEYFEECGDDEAFIAAYEIFSASKNDIGFINTLLNLDVKLSNLTDPGAFISFALDNYSEITEKEEIFDTFYGKNLKEQIKLRADRVIKVFEGLLRDCTKYDALVEKYYPVIENGYEFAREVFHTCDKGYEELRALVNDYKPMNFSGKILPKDFKDISLKEHIANTKKAVGDEFSSYLKGICTCDTELLKKAAKDTRLVLSKLTEIAEKFRTRLCDRKKELAILEFSDVERYALSLFVKSENPFEVTDLARLVSAEFTEIYIDEYQDVNPLQDMIFRAISKHDERGEYNRFMVGDVKQSIYRFRGASSDIFMSYRDTFSDAKSDSNTRKIYMSDNFRCCESVIELTNRLFETLMGASYEEGDRLLFSRHEKNKVSHKAKLCAFYYDKETANGIPSIELEAEMICRKVLEVVNNPAYTDSDGKMFKFSDVGILAKGNEALKVFENVLTSRGIPVNSSVGESFYGKREIILCINILNAIDNPERDVYLAGFMRSFAGGFGDDELAIIKNKYKKMSLYRAVVKAGGEDSLLDENLRNKCAQFVEKLREYRRISRGKSAHKLLDRLYHDFDMLSVCTSPDFTDDPTGARKNLLKLYQMARDFSGTSFRGVNAFVEYVEGSMKKSDIKSERESATDCVSLMTIHASKGLEFPVCFVSNISKRFNKSDESERLVFSEKAGIATSLCDTKIMESTSCDTALITIKTPFKKFVGSVIDTELIAEETRVLYVALTRARDMLFMTGFFTKKVENAMRDAQISHSAGMFASSDSYFSMLLSALANEKALEPFYEEAGIVPDGLCDTLSDYLESEFVSCESLAQGFIQDSYGETGDEEGPCVTLDDELIKQLEKLSKCDLRTNSVPSKLTVSQLKIGLIDIENIRKEQLLTDENEVILPKFIDEEKLPDSAEKGTAMHMFMQFCDFEGCEKSCSEEADRLYENGFITKTQREILDTARLDAFFCGEFYHRMKKSKKIYREQRFNLEADSFEGGVSGDILVQGVIDLFFENEDGTYTVVDFKTDRVFGDGAEAVLVERHRDQLLYYKTAVEQMTGKQVSDAVIYSFSLMRQISVD